LIRSEVLGELKEGAAGLVALAELLASRRIGPKVIALALPSAREACAGVATAAEKLAADVVAAARGYPDAAQEIRAIYDATIAHVRALEREIAAAEKTSPDARGRL
jgi:hypothetical protein